MNTHMYERDASSTVHAVSVSGGLQIHYRNNLLRHWTQAAKSVPTNQKLFVFLINIYYNKCLYNILQMKLIIMFIGDKCKSHFLHSFVFPLGTLLRRFKCKSGGYCIRISSNKQLVQQMDGFY